MVPPVPIVGRALTLSEPSEGEGYNCDTGMAFVQFLASTYK